MLAYYASTLSWHISGRSTMTGDASLLACDASRLSYDASALPHTSEGLCSGASILIGCWQRSSVKHDISWHSMKLYFAPKVDARKTMSLGPQCTTEALCIKLCAFLLLLWEATTYNNGPNSLRFNLLLLILHFNQQFMLHWLCLLTAAALQTTRLRQNPKTL